MAGCFPRRRRHCCVPLGSFHFGNKEAFRDLVRKQKFSRIRVRLEDKRFVTENTKWLYEGMKYQTPLHFILPFRPPLIVVNLILEYTNGECHVPEEALDLEGRTPLHIAAAHNCSFDIMERLLSGVSLVVPALTKDSMGRCPLHWACCYRSLPGREESDNKFDSILLLLDAYPQAVVVADKDGKTPLNYATYRLDDQRIVDVLDRATKRQKEPVYQPKRKTKSSRTLGEHLGSNQKLNDSMSVDSGVPSEVNGRPGASRFFLARYLFPSNEDDVSSIGLDRSVAGPSASIDGCRSPAPKTAYMESERMPAALPGLEEEDPENEPRSLLPWSAHMSGPYPRLNSQKQQDPKIESKQRSGSAKVRSTSLFIGNLQQPSEPESKFTEPTDEGWAMHHPREC